MRYVFQETFIWDGGSERPDPDRPVQIIKAKSEARALRKLPKPAMGRHWVLVETTLKPTD